MKTRIQTLSLLAGLVALPLVACGGGSGDGALGTDIAPDTRLSELSQEESNELCEASSAEFDSRDSESVSCYFLAQLTSSSQEQCQAAYDQCMQDPVEVTDCEEDALDTAELPDCASEVTVGEMESCFQAQADMMRELEASLSCDPEADDVALPETPEECQRLEDKCPELFSDDESE